MFVTSQVTMFAKCLGQVKLFGKTRGVSLYGKTNYSTRHKISHNASPRLPLLYYKATPRAMSSINHRLFYANWIFVFAAYDFLTAYVDI